VFSCVGWKVTLCAPTWQVTLRSSEMEFIKTSTLPNFTYHTECVHRLETESDRGRYVTLKGSSRDLQIRSLIRWELLTA